MKTLTSLNALVDARDEFWIGFFDPGVGAEKTDRLKRQAKKFEAALTKRLQEQEEELDELRRYKVETIIWLAKHGRYKDTTKKEKTNE